MKTTISDCRLSIIIPMYQAEQYIEECINSVLCQPVQAIEILCMDDGSTDRTCDIIKTAMEKDSRIHLFHLTHKGVGSARNRGIEEAHGNYILFLDADDMLLPGKLPVILQKAESNKTDIITFSGTTNVPYGTPLWIREGFSAPNRFYTAFFPELFLQIKSCRPSACNKLYRRQYLIANRYRFPENLPLAEDHVFQFIVYPKAQNIAFTRTRLYYYRIQQTHSTMELYRNKEQDRFEWHRKAMSCISKHWQQEKYFGQKNYCSVYITAYLDLLFDTLQFVSGQNRIARAAAMWNDITNISADALPNDPRIDYLQYCQNHSPEESNRLLTEIISASDAHPIYRKLTGPIRYYRKVGLHAAIEHYIGRLLKTEP